MNLFLIPIPPAITIHKSNKDCKNMFVENMPEEIKYLFIGFALLCIGFYIYKNRNSNKNK